MWLPGACSGTGGKSDTTQQWIGNKLTRSRTSSHCRARGAMDGKNTQDESTAPRHSRAQSRFFHVGINTHKHTAVFVHVTGDENCKSFRAGIRFASLSLLLFTALKKTVHFTGPHIHQNKCIVIPIRNAEHRHNANRKSVKRSRAVQVFKTRKRLVFTRRKNTGTPKYLFITKSSISSNYHTVFTSFSSSWTTSDLIHVLIMLQRDYYSVTDKYH